MKHLIKIFLPLTLLLYSVSSFSQIDPNGCRATPFTAQEWRDIGFEPVDAWGANPNDNNDDTAAIQNAIDAAIPERRSIMLFPANTAGGGYIITPEETTVPAILDANDEDGDGNTTEELIPEQIFRAALHIDQDLYNRNDDRHEGNFG